MNLKQIPLDDRPREKIMAKGVHSLSDKELLAVILGNGTQECPVMDLAQKILNLLDKCHGIPDAKIFMKIKGMGLAKTSLLLAVLEYARRRLNPQHYKIIYPVDILPLIRHFADRKQETLVCVSLNGANEVMAKRIVTMGLVNQTQVHPREVFAEPIKDRATGIIIAHNHPSGKLYPSPQDNKVTHCINEAGKILGIKLLDHIIFNHIDYFSFLENGQL